MCGVRPGGGGVVSLLDHAAHSRSSRGDILVAMRCHGWSGHAGLAWVSYFHTIDWETDE